ncbi:ABC transporter substrate-binding protein [Zoogloeaceae bacterium G21618-S1]|nr:ABC transporter substrate-binding protein [Zoogloeaceae bacterium G21618-S1]
MNRILSLLCALALTGFSSLATGHGDPVYDSYDLAPRALGVDIGVQPLGYPTGLVGAVMGRDRILRRALSALGHGLHTFAFRRGPDIVERMGNGRLEAGLVGDMPTIAAIAAGDTLVAGIVKLSSSSIVSRESGLVESLRGRRIAYVEGSSAHHTLLEGLSSAGLSESDVTLVPMDVNDMPAALRSGDISAFAAWEPAPSIALSENAAHRIVFRGRSTDYLLLSRDFEAAHPQAARHLVAALIRATRWMQLNRSNIETAAHWTMADGAKLTGHPTRASVAQAVSITRAELLDVPAVPTIPASSRGMHGLAGKLSLLQRLDKVPDTINGDQIERAFAFSGLQDVLSDPAKYHFNNFDYDR